MMLRHTAPRYVKLKEEKVNPRPTRCSKAPVDAPLNPPNQGSGADTTDRVVNGERISVQRPTDGPRNYRRAAGAHDLSRIYAAAYAKSDSIHTSTWRAEAREAVQDFIKLLDSPVEDEL